MVLDFFHLHDAKVVKHFPYRTGRPVQSFLKVEYGHDDSVYQFHRILAEKAGVRPDNHVCYLLEMEHGGQIGVRFSDWAMILSLGIKEGQF